MRLIIAEDDRVSRIRLEAVMKRAKRDVILTSNGVEALRAFERGVGPTMLLLDWVMPEMDGVTVCREIRRTSSAAVYIVFMTAHGRHENLLEALEAGADDFLTKPFTTEALLARIRLGERVLRAATASELLFEEALADGIRSPGGLVVTREGGTVGRVFFHAGRIAWAHISGEPSGIDDVLGDAAALSREEIASVVAECRENQRHFADVLVEWGLVDAATMRACLRVFLAQRLARMAQFHDARAMFIPEPRTLTGSFSFALDEVFVPERRAPRTLFPPARQVPPIEEMSAFSAAAAVEGATSVCVVHLPSATLLSRHLDAPEPDVLRAMLAVFHVSATAETDEIAVTDRDAFHFLQRIDGPGERCLYARLPRETTLLAMARMQIGLLAARLAATPPDAD